MATVAIHPPKTPCTKGSNGIAAATLPNVCKMPGPPAPFVPTPLPNIAKSGTSPKNYSTTVKIEGNTVAIRGALFESMGDVASKGTGGGLLSSNTHGPAKFITPGSMTVKIQGKSVHLLGEPMLNNCGPSGSPPNTGATMTGLMQMAVMGGANPLEIKCEDAPAKPGSTKFTKCEKEELCAKCASINQQANSNSGPYGGLKRIRQSAYEVNRADGDSKCASLNRAARAGNPADLGFCPVSPECEKELKDKATANNYKGFSPDHIHEIQLGGHPTAASNLRWMSSAPNSWIGGQMKKYDPDTHTGVKPDCCG
ncbi:MAG: PAAR-like domain-containing protein [Gammaproteobacteria bacterium]